MLFPARASAAGPTKVLLILYDGFNTLDMNGPYDVLTRSGFSKNFSVTVASETPITKSFEGALVQRNIALDEALVADAPKDFDMLVVPGGDTGHVFKQAALVHGLTMRLIKNFANTSKLRSANQPRVVMSVCTGAFLVAALGIFDGLFCTTHWGSLPKLVQYVDDAAAQTRSQPGSVIPARFVDAGKNKAGVHVVSSGGISCGIDASLYVVGKMYGEEEALETARLLDYAWRRTDGVAMGEDRFAPVWSP